VETLPLCGAGKPPFFLSPVSRAWAACWSLVPRLLGYLLRDLLLGVSALIPGRARPVCPRVSRLKPAGPSGKGAGAESGRATGRRSEWAPFQWEGRNPLHRLFVVPGLLVPRLLFACYSRCPSPCDTALCGAVVADPVRTLSGRPVKNSSWLEDLFKSCTGAAASRDPDPLLLSPLCPMAVRSGRGRLPECGSALRAPGPLVLARRAFPAAE
jgi:hypothetical protein